MRKQLQKGTKRIFTVQNKQLDEFANLIQDKVVALKILIFLSI